MRSVIDSPLARIEVIEDSGIVRSVHFAARASPTREVGPMAGKIAATMGTTANLRTMRVDLGRFSDFERRVLEETRRIPAGQVRTYGQVAAAVGRPKAARAVGNALGKNTACVVVPCHRVVASNGIGGFSGDLAVKRRLLRAEGVVL